MEPFINAIKLGDLDLFKSLSEKNPQELTTYDYNGETVLHFACRADNLDISKYIMENTDSIEDYVYLTNCVSKDMKKLLIDNLGYSESSIYDLSICDDHEMLEYALKTRPDFLEDNCCDLSELDEKCLSIIMSYVTMDNIENIDTYTSDCRFLEDAWSLAKKKKQFTKRPIS